MKLDLLKYYLLAINIIAICLTVYDKFASKKRRKKRIREKTLLWIAIFGGSAGMLFSMLLIRHKTRHKRFMVGLPLLLIFQWAIFYGILHW